MFVYFSLRFPTTSMSTKLPRELKHDAIILSDKGYTQTAISDILKISVSSIQRAKYKLRDHGDIEGGSKKRGRKAKLSPDLEDVTLCQAVSDFRRYCGLF